MRNEEGVGRIGHGACMDTYYHMDYFYGHLTYCAGSEMAGNISLAGI